MRSRTWWMTGLVAVAAVAAAAIALRDQGLAVDTAAVSRGVLEVTVDEEGRTRVRERYVVAAPVSGRLERMNVREGDRVSEGDLLARVYSTPEDPREVATRRGQLAAAEARQLEAVALVDTARAREEQTARDLERAERLSAAGALSRQALEQARLAATAAGRQLESSQAARRAAEAGVAAARAALMGVRSDGPAGGAVAVHAPTSGRILRVLQESARVVQAGTPLVEIGDAAGLEAVVDVLTEDAVRIAPGAPVRIARWGGDTVLQGQVRHLEPEAFTKISALGVEEQRVNVIVDLVDPPSSLGAGYRLEGRIVTWSGEVLRVPASALFQEQGTWAVFVVENGRARRRPVRIGHRNDEAAEVLEGLGDGDRVILYPSDQIGDGVRIQ